MSDHKPLQILMAGWTIESVECETVLGTQSITFELARGEGKRTVHIFADDSGIEIKAEQNNPIFKPDSVNKR